MTWVKLDDQFPDHPKVEKAGERAAWLFICGLCYCAEHLTDGFIPASKAQRLTGQAGPRIEKLLEVGLWEQADGGYLVSRYLQYQPPKSSVVAEREAARKRMSHARTNSQRCSDDVRPNMERTSPNPVPVPIPKEEKTRSLTFAASDDFDRFWQAYPRRVGKQAALKAWRAALKRGAESELILAAAASYAASVSGADPQFIAHPATWLNAGRYEDEPPPKATASREFWNN